MEIRVHLSHGAHVLALSGRWDAFSAAEFEETCGDLIDKGMREVVIDVADVDYMSSFGLRSLLNLGKRLEPLHGRVHVSSLQPHVRKIFVGSGFNSLFPEYPDVDTAVRALRSGA